MKVLIIAAHPDDDVLGMGGTILKHSTKGDRVKVVYMTTGITARRSLEYHNITNYEYDLKQNSKLKKEIERLRQDARTACKFLQVKEVKFYNYPDNEMDTVPLLKVIKTIEKEIDESKPDRIYTNHYGDLNIDHRIVFNATLTACRPIGNKIKELICFEVISSSEWSYPTNFKPNYFVNIKSQLDKKIRAMQAYRSEIRKFPHPRSVNNLKMVAGRWGTVSGNYAAEAFEIIRKIDI